MLRRVVRIALMAVEIARKLNYERIFSIGTLVITTTSIFVGLYFTIPCIRKLYQLWKYLQIYLRVGELVFLMYIY